MKELKNYYVKTYGCAMNYADANRIRSILNGVKLQEVFDVKDTDLIVLVSCSVRKQAEDKIAGWGIKRAKKNEGDRKVFLLTGCMAVRHDRQSGNLIAKYTKQIERKYPWVDHIVDIQDIEEIPKLLGLKKINTKRQNDYLNITPFNQSEKIVNVPISTGCNFFCSYCIVPFSRGELLHRDYRDILNEVKSSLEQGAKVICLVSQNVNSWVGLREGKKISFAQLLEDVASIEGDFWINFVSSNPMEFSSEIIGAISKNKKIMRWVNIAVQSGSDSVLKKMNRKYTVDEFEKLIGNIKDVIPDIRLTTDIIVGFPGEGKDDFEKTLTLIKKLEFQMVYIGKYSPRELSASAKLEDDVSRKEKKKREDILKEEVNKMRGRFHKNFVGKKLKVLVLGGRRGLSYYYHEVLFEKPISKNKIGTFLDVLVTDSTLSGLVAKE